MQKSLPQPNAAPQKRNAEFDFPESKAPELFPLEKSHAVDSVEAQIKQLAMHLWQKHLADKAFDVSVIGAAHLGSFEQVRRMVNQDGLALIPNAVEEPRTRYLYRAWKSQNHQGRGLHFLNTYLQMLFPNLAKAEQLWMEYEGNYPDDAFPITPIDDYFFPLIQSATILRVDGKWNLGEMVNANDLVDGDLESSVSTEGLFLTSRVRVTLDFGVEMEGIGNLLQIFRAVMPARLVPVFHYVVEIDSPQIVVSEIWIECEIDYEPLAVYMADLVVSERPEWLWHIGSDSDVQAAQRLDPERVSGWIESRVGEWPDYEFVIDAQVGGVLETNLQVTWEVDPADVPPAQYHDAVIELPYNVHVLVDLMPTILVSDFESEMGMGWQLDMPVQAEVQEFDARFDVDAQMPEILGIFESFDLDFDFAFAQPETTLFMPDEDFVFAQVQAVQLGGGAIHTEIEIDGDVPVQSDALFGGAFSPDVFMQYTYVAVTSEPENMWFVGDDEDAGRAQRLHKTRLRIWGDGQEPDDDL